MKQDYFSLTSATAHSSSGAAGLACLAWQVAMGADEAHAPAPQNRFLQTPPKKIVGAGDVRADSDRPINKMVPDDKEESFEREELSITPYPRRGRAVAPATPAAPATAILGSFAASRAAEALAAECKNLADIAGALDKYDGCPLKNMARKTVVGDGYSDQPALMVIGDAPDEIDDRHGTPFSGPAGQLVRRALAAGGFSADKNCYFTNSLYWKRPGSRAANLGEQKSCLPFLLKQIELIRPSFILVMGIGGCMGFFDSTLAKCRGQKNLTIAAGG